MDIQKIIGDLVSRLTGNSDLISQFTSDPAKLIKKLTGLDIGGAELTAVIQGVGEKLGLNVEDLLKQGGGFLSGLKGLFGRK